MSRTPTHICTGRVPLHILCGVEIPKHIPNWEYLWFYWEFKDDGIGTWCDECSSLADLWALDNTDLENPEVGWITINEVSYGDRELHFPPDKV